MTIGIWGISVIVIISVLCGFWLGRSVVWLAADTEQKAVSNIRIPMGLVVVSPVSGALREHGTSGKNGAAVYPENGKVYAPISGKITKLYPMGRAMVIQAETGVEVYVGIGDSIDELNSMLFTCRVMENEIVGKGKLLLEFDKQELEAAGEDVTVTISAIVADQSREIAVTAGETVRVGDELMRVCQA